MRHSNSMQIKVVVVIVHRPEAIQDPNDPLDTIQVYGVFSGWGSAQSEMEIAQAEHPNWRFYLADETLR